MRRFLDWKLNQICTLGYQVEDAKFADSRYRYVDPRSASVPPDLGKVFTVRVDGIDQGEIIKSLTISEQ